MPKYDFNKVTLQLYLHLTLAWVFSCKFAAYFQNTYKNTSGEMLLTRTLTWLLSKEFNFYHKC